MQAMEHAAYLVQTQMTKLPEKYHAAANSLVQAYRTKPERFSDKQAQFLQNLADMLTPKDATTAKPADKFSNVIALFDHAKANGLKTPKIRLDLAGEKIVLAVAGANARLPGTVNVTDGSPFGANVFYGRVNLDGTFEQRVAKPGLVELLRGLQGDALQLAKDYGRRTGTCCMCGRTLTDKVSIDNGIGPICQTNFFG